MPITQRLLNQIHGILVDAGFLLDVDGTPPTDEEMRKAAALAMEDIYVPSSIEMAALRRLPVVNFGVFWNFFAANRSANPGLESFLPGHAGVTSWAAHLELRKEQKGEALYFRTVQPTELFVQASRDNMAGKFSEAFRNFGAAGAIYSNVGDVNNSHAAYYQQGLAALGLAKAIHADVLAGPARLHYHVIWLERAAYAFDLAIATNAAVQQPNAQKARLEVSRKLYGLYTKPKDFGILGNDFKRLGDPLWAARCYHNQAVLYYRMSQSAPSPAERPFYQKNARAAIDKAITDFRENDEKSLLVKSLEMRVTIAMQDGQNHEYAATACLELAKYYQKIGDPVEALKALAQYGYLLTLVPNQSGLNVNQGIALMRAHPVAEVRENLLEKAARELSRDGRFIEEARVLETLQIVIVEARPDVNLMHLSQRLQRAQEATFTHFLNLMEIRRTARESDADFAKRIHEALNTRSYHEGALPTGLQEDIRTFDPTNANALEDMRRLILCRLGATVMPTDTPLERLQDMQNNRHDPRNERREREERFEPSRKPRGI